MTDKLTHFWDELLIDPYEVVFERLNNLPDDSFRSPFTLAGAMGIKVSRSSKLTDKVSGFVTVINEYPVIVINSNKPKMHRDYTILHEIVHYIVHLDSGTHDNNENMELQAEVISLHLLLRVSDPNQFQDYLKYNPTVAAYLFSVGMLGAVSLLVVGVYKLRKWWGSRSENRQSDYH